MRTLPNQQYAFRNFPDERVTPGTLRTIQQAQGLAAGQLPDNIMALTNEQPAPAMDLISQIAGPMAQAGAQQPAPAMDLISQIAAPMGRQQTGDAIERQFGEGFRTIRSLQEADAADRVARNPGYAMASEARGAGMPMGQAGGGGMSQTARDTERARARTQPGVNVPQDVRAIQMAGGPRNASEAQRMAAFAGSTMGRNMMSDQAAAAQAAADASGFASFQEAQAAVGQSGGRIVQGNDGRFRVQADLQTPGQAELSALELERRRLDQIIKQDEFDTTVGGRQAMGSVLDQILEQGGTPEAVQAAQRRLAQEGRPDLAMQIGQQFQGQQEANELSALELERRRLEQIIKQDEFDTTVGGRQAMGSVVDQILEQGGTPEAVQAAQRRLAQEGRPDLAMQIGQQFQGQQEANDVRSRKINDLMTEMSGLSRLQAIDLVDGHARVINNPETGDVSLVNVRTGELSPVNLSDEFRAASDARGGRVEQQGGPISLYGSARETTGIFPAARAAAQRLTGQVNINTAPPELLENMQMFSAAQNDLIRALSINPRFPVAEMQRIQKEIDITPGAFMDPQTLQSKMRSVDRYLRNRVDREERASRDPSIPATERRAAITSANNIRNFLDVLGVPGEATDTEGQGQEDYEIPPINVLPDEKLQRLNRYLQ